MLPLFYIILGNANMAALCVCKILRYIFVATCC